jgi:hypothetical protein
MRTKLMNNDTTNNGAVESNKHVRNIFVLKISVFHSGIGGLHAHSITCLPGRGLYQIFYNGVNCA